MSEGHVVPSSDEAAPCEPGVWMQRTLGKGQFCTYYTPEKVTSVVPKPSPDEVLALHDAAQEGTDAAPEEIRFVTLPEIQSAPRMFLVAGGHRYAALSHPDISLGDDHPVTYWELLVEREDDHAIAHRVSTLAIDYIKTAENRYRTLPHERFKYAFDVLGTLYNNDIKRWAKDWCCGKRGSNTYISEKNQTAAVRALAKLRLSGEQADVLASARLDQLLALADEMAARKRVTRPATERIPIFNWQMLFMLGKIKSEDSKDSKDSEDSMSDWPLGCSEDKWTSFLARVRFEMNKAVNGGSDDVYTFEQMFNLTVHGWLAG